ncbi:S53 family peptidase [Nocardioides lianchengensis]|uniref:Pro-kumamolisin, activation domain n=1 Tax=Nocardioides lianchengensis TaxID=1045774 RepID=A0A1G7A9Z4_9ACTN|nr:S53 family peptidase [Nocardioides lianchengensis]NYG13682.1 subtilase family serine protease [Nocardioides lianchengensis]SDE10845.1 Pro-kumamolisin, activation domain [Nocardioides lianchengensis]
MPVSRTPQRGVPLLVAVLAAATLSVPLSGAPPASAAEPAERPAARTVLAGSRLDLAALDTGRRRAVPDREVVRLSVLLPWRGEGAATPRQVRRAARWLRAQRLAVTAVRRDLGVVEVRGRVGRVERALRTRLVRVETDGVEIVAPARAVSVPRGLRIQGVAGLVRTPAVPMSITAPAVTTGPQTSDGCARYWGERVSDRWPARPAVTTRSNRLCGYSPTDLRALHRVPAGITGEGARVGIVGTYDDPAVAQNTDDYFTETGGAPFRPGQYVVHHTAEDDTACGDREGWSEEQHLDVQAVHAMAPDAKVVYWASPTCYSHDLFQTLLDAVESGEVDVISMSLGSREEHGTDADRALLHRAVVQASLRGVSVFAAAGNDGDYSDEGDHAGELDVTSPASSPWVTAVGGLSMGMRRDGSYAAIGGWASTPYFARNGGLIPPGFHAGGGGGASHVHARPGWQRGHVPATLTDGSGAGRRLLPDVAALADPLTGFTTRIPGPDGPTYRAIGGTSLATPSVATLVAMAKARSGRRIGLATPWLYRLAGTAALRDVTPPNAGLWSATALGGGQTWPETVVTVDRRPQSLVSGPGWDPLTGVGLPGGAAFFDLFGTAR